MFRATADKAHLWAPVGALPAAHDVLGTIPHRTDGRAVVLRHDLATWRALRALDLSAPCPVPYPGPCVPWPHQRETTEYLLSAGAERCCVLDAMGTGKTLSCLWAADHLLAQGEIDRVLIVAPLSGGPYVWMRELRRTFRLRRAAQLSGSRATRRALAADLRIPYLVINHDALRLVADLLIGRRVLVIYDEATAVKTVSSRRWKTLHSLRPAHLWLLTGTPLAQSPLDAHGLLRLVRTDCARLSRSVWRDMTMRQVSPFRWVPRHDAGATVAKWLQPAVRHQQPFTFSVQYIDLPVSLSREQLALCAQLTRDARAHLAGHEITAPNAAAVLTKLLQVQCGGVYARSIDGERRAVPVPAPDLHREIVRFVAEADTPVLVFAPFRAAVASAVAALERSGLACATVIGDTPLRERLAAYDAVNAGALRALVAVPSTMSHCLTLTTARYVLWVAPPFRAEEYGQANARVVRPGQRSSVVIARLIPSSLVSSLYARLASKSALQAAVLDLLQSSV